jgi:N-alpha-acetyltransferase 15/16, NatA auxiliary subunit
LAETEAQLLALLDSEGVTFELAGTVLDTLKTWRSKEAAAFRSKAQGKWPGVTLFA